jgi:hypothetical protein
MLDAILNDPDLFSLCRATCEENEVCVVGYEGQVYS